MQATGLTIHLEYVVIRRSAVRCRLSTGAASSSFSTPGLDQRRDGPGVLALRTAYGLVFVGVNERADPFVGKDLGEEPSSATRPSMMCIRGTPPRAARTAHSNLETHGGPAWSSARCFRIASASASSTLTCLSNSSRMMDAAGRGEVNQLHRLQGPATSRATASELRR